MGKELKWRVNTPQLIKECIENNPSAWVLNAPFMIFKSILAELADRARQIDDKELNKIMLRMALYEEGDPYAKDYNADFVNEYLES